MNEQYLTISLREPSWISLLEKLLTMSDSQFSYFFLLLAGLFVSEQPTDRNICSVLQVLGLSNAETFEKEICALLSIFFCFYFRQFQRATLCL